MASEYLKWKYRDVQPERAVELTSQQKRANWWYYHKWHVLLGAGLIALGVAGVILPTASALLHNTSTLLISLRSMGNLLDGSDAGTETAPSRFLP